jgi:hypothetical protein
MKKAFRLAVAMSTAAAGLALTLPGAVAGAAVTSAHARAASTAVSGRLYAVTAVSARGVWAVGGTNWFSPSHPLAQHWNGRSWTQVRTPSPAGGELTGVAATSASSAWAVGWTGPASEGTGQRTLVEHWNGRTWSRVPSPNPPGSTASFLKGVTVISADSAWAVGSSTVDGLSKTLVLYWRPPLDPGAKPHPWG